MLHDAKPTYACDGVCTWDDICWHVCVQQDMSPGIDCFGHA